MPFKRVPGLRSVYVAARLAKTMAAVKVSRVVLVDGTRASPKVTAIFFGSCMSFFLLFGQWFQIKTPDPKYKKH